jgi:hypothetical protein
MTIDLSIRRQVKILINAYPHAGVEQFYSLLASTIRADRTENMNELAEGSEWIIWKKEPVISLGNYGEDVTLCTIIREPAENIAINVCGWFTGKTGQIIYGSEVMKKENIKEELVLSEKDIKFINHQMMVYKSYMRCALLNKDINVFSTDQMKSDPVKTVNKMLDLSGSTHRRDFGNAVLKRGFTDDAVNQDHYDMVVSYIHSTDEYKEIFALYSSLLEKV